VLKHYEQQLKNSTEVLMRNNTELKNLLNESLNMVSKTKEENEELKKKIREYERQLRESSNSSGKYSQDTGRIFQLRKHYEEQLTSLINNTENLQKNHTQLQNILKESLKIASQQGEENQALKQKTRECESRLQESSNSILKYFEDVER